MAMFSFKRIPFINCVHKNLLKDAKVFLIVLLTCTLIVYMLPNGTLKHFHRKYLSKLHGDYLKEKEQTKPMAISSVTSVKENPTDLFTKQKTSMSTNMTITKGINDNISQDNITLRSRTKPKFYPYNGTGKAVDIRNIYDFGVFNSFCNVDWTMRAVLPVFSAPGNMQKRKAIRETVGRECTYFKCHIFFIVGISLNDSLNNEVKDEYHTEKDILIDNRIDTYRDCNNKVVAMLDWLIKYCPSPKYVIHFIDDAYPNIGTIIDQLDGLTGNKYMVGFKVQTATPYRDPKSKWYTSFDEWPYQRYPQYISGPTYSFLNKDSKLLRNHVHLAVYVWSEDVWFTGLVAKEANFTLIPLIKRYVDRVPNLTQQNWISYSLIHHVTPDNYYWIYNNAAKTDNSTD